MTHITRVQLTQIQTQVKAGADMAEIGTLYRIPIKRIEALTGISRKDNLSQVKELAEAVETAVDAAADFSDPAAAGESGDTDDFTEE